MIHYALRCANAHDFDGWFASSGAFETQCQAGHLVCPFCGSDEVARALMAPAVRTGTPAPSAGEGEPQDAPERGAPSQEPVATTPTLPPMAPSDHAALMDAVRALRQKIVEHGTDVGSRFPEEARRIHYGEAEPRGIYGQAELEEARALIEEGIDVIALPVLPEDRN